MVKCLECDVSEDSIGENVNRHFEQTGHTNYSRDNESFSYPPLPSVEDPKSWEPLTSIIDQERENELLGIIQQREKEIAAVRSVAKTATDLSDTQGDTIRSQSLLITDLELQISALKTLKDLNP